MKDIDETLKEEDKMAFTGERFVPQEIFGEIEVEHFHRYMAVSDLIRGKIVLDAASGEGYGSYFMSETAKFVYGIDISSEVIIYSQKKYVKDTLVFKQNSIAKLDFPDNYFDVVVSFETIEHVDTKIQILFLAEVKRVLKEDGVFVISTPNKELYSDQSDYINEFHIKEFYKDEFIDFLKIRFNEVKIFHQYITGSSVISNDLSDNARKINLAPQKEGKYFIALASNREITLSEHIDSIYEYDHDQEVFATLFYWGGNDYDYHNFERKMFPVPENGSVIDIKFNINRETKKLRFDPLEGTPCKISVLRIESNGSHEEVRAFNASHTEIFEGFSYDVFWNEDPIYVINGSFQPGDSLEIKIKVSLLDRGETYFNLNQIVNKQNVKIEMLKSESDILRSETRILKEETRKLDEEILRLTSVFQTETARIVNDYNEEMAKLNRNFGMEIAKFDDEVAKFDDEVAKLRDTLNQKNLEINLLTNYVNDIQDSVSWKITKPLRKISKSIKKDG